MIISFQPQIFTLTNLSGVKPRQDLGQNGVEDMIQLTWVLCNPITRMKNFYLKIEINRCSQTQLKITETWTKRLYYGTWKYDTTRN